MRRGSATTRPRSPRRPARSTRARRPRAAPPRDLRESLESTHRGLEAFLAGLERSGFRSAAGPYRDMQLILLGQRLWSRGHDREDLDELWSAIAATAGEIHAALSGLHAVMGELATLDRIEPAGDGTARLPPSPESELASALLGGVAVSARSLAAALGWPDDVRRQRLAALVQRGVLERRGWGRSLSYRLAPTARERAGRELAAALGGGRG